ncbi:31234_t:CDS:2, partial [Gigaspora margarita]
SSNAQLHLESYASPQNLYDLLSIITMWTDNNIFFKSFKALITLDVNNGTVPSAIPNLEKISQIVAFQPNQYKTTASCFSTGLCLLCRISLKISCDEEISTTFQSQLEINPIATTSSTNAFDENRSTISSNKQKNITSKSSTTRVVESKHINSPGEELMTR